MNEQGHRILEYLRHVEEERTRRALDRWLHDRVVALKRYQHARLQQTYADLLSMQRYHRAATFFLEDLYGPKDFSTRDQQFAKVVPGIVRLFPGEILQTVEHLAELHALSEVLDSEMASAIDHVAPSRLDYVRAWQHVGRPDDRARQIQLMRDVGDALDRYTHKPMLRRTLHWMHRPAHVMGLGALQDFLETGFDTFKEMQGAGAFLDTIHLRETRLAQELFDARLPELSGSLLDQLP